MALNYYNAFSFYAHEEEGEEDFEESDIELYKNKQNFPTVFSNQLFGKEGKYFFPGTYDEAYLFVTELGVLKDKETFFTVYYFPPLLIGEIKDWSYGKIVCSALYYFLNIKIAKNDLTPVDWSLIADLILSPAISREVFFFLNQNNIVNFASENNHISGFRESVLIPSYVYYYNPYKALPDVRIYYRLLKLANVEKSIIRDLIKTVITEQNRKSIVDFLDNHYSKLKRR